METLGMEDDEPIEHKMITNAIAKAQKKVEGHNFEIRKHLLEYDNVMNEQRRVIYKLRRDILDDNDNLGFIKEMIEDVSGHLIDAYRPERKVPIDSWPWEEMRKGFKTTFYTEYDVNTNECNQRYDADLENYFSSIAKELLEKKFAEYDEEQVQYAIREILLSIFDQHWKDHLLSMDHLKEGINLRAYAQKNPMTEYKRESFSLFENMKIEVKKSVVQNIFSVQLYTQEEIEELKRKQQEMLEAQIEAHKKAQEAAEKAEAGKSTPVTRSTNKVGRNDPCPCGSGKKFKHCHGA